MNDVNSLVEVIPASPYARGVVIPRECPGCEHCDGEGGHPASLEGDEGHAEDAHDGARAKLSNGHLRFVLAGRAVFTLRSTRTGTRFTYRVRAKVPTTRIDDPAIFFVEVLTGSDNTGDYSYLGTIFPNDPARGSFPTFSHGKKSRIGREAASAKAFAWAFSFIRRGAEIPTCEFWHEGACGRCGRPLTDPESIASGLGPVCIEKG